MKPLPGRLRKNGYDYTLAQRGKRSCIYEQKVTEKQSYYEVFLIKVRPERTLRGKIIESCERFPFNEAFGYWAWTFRSWPEALKVFHDIETDAEL